MFNRTERHEFHFEYDSRLCWFKLDVDRHMKAVERIQMAEPDLDERDAKAKALKESGAVAEIANCYPTPLYFQKSEATDEARYYMRVDFPNGSPPVKATFTAAQLSSASEFKSGFCMWLRAQCIPATPISSISWQSRIYPGLKRSIRKTSSGTTKSSGLMYSMTLLYITARSIRSMMRIILKCGI